MAASTTAGVAKLLPDRFGGPDLSSGRPRHAVRTRLVDVEQGELPSPSQSPYTCCADLKSVPVKAKVRQ